MELNNGDVYLNPYFGDLWIASNNSIVRINTGETLHVDSTHPLILVGHVENVESLETNFYHKLRVCPICKSNQVNCVVDSSNFLWKIGCSTRECPCYIGSMIGKYSRKDQAVDRWNNI